MYALYHPVLAPSHNCGVVVQYRLFVMLVLTAYAIRHTGGVHKPQYISLVLSGAPIRTSHHISQSFRPGFCHDGTVHTTTSQLTSHHKKAISSSSKPRKTRKEKKKSREKKENMNAFPRYQHNIPSHPCFSSSCFVVSLLLCPNQP